MKSIQSHFQRGFSLIELMIAMVLGLFLSFGLANILLSGKLTYTTDEESARMQENARFALNYIARELTMSSFVGGLIQPTAPTAVAISNDCATNWATDFNRTLEIVDNWQTGIATTSVGTNLGCISSQVNDSDILAVKRTSDQAAPEDGTEDDNQLYLRAEDFGSSLSFEYVGASDSFDSLTANVDYWKYYSKVLFVRSFSNTSGDGIPSLCMSHLTGNSMTTECLAEGVEAIQIEFGADNDGDGQADYFVTSPDATESEQLLSAKIYVLMRSIGTTPNYTNDTSYTLGNTAINGGNAFGDRYQRRVYSSTVKLRNPVRL